MGWFGYELKRFTGGRDAPETPQAELPDAVFLVPDRILAFDADTRKVHAFLPLGPEAGPSAEATAWLDSLEAIWDIPAAPEPRLRREPGGSGSHAPLRLPWRLSAPKSEYLDSIRSLQEAILRGDTYEACLTNELKVESGADPFLTYRMLRRTNPAPYAAYFRFPQGAILSASPERFLKLDARGNLASRPIKGTRPRGATDAEDTVLKADLAGNAKDRSENLMIVDLVRNDFGRVCALGSVRVPELMKVEAHPTVLQLVSTVLGRLERG